MCVNCARVVESEKAVLECGKCGGESFGVRRCRGHAYVKCLTCKLNINLDSLIYLPKARDNIEYVGSAKDE